jgi:hypothetical protein
MCGFEWKHGVNGGHSCAETLLANIAALKFDNERLQAHNAMLLVAGNTLLSDWGKITHQTFSGAFDMENAIAANRHDVDRWISRVKAQAIAEALGDAASSASQTGGRLHEKMVAEKIRGIAAEAKNNAV